MNIVAIDIGGTYIKTGLLTINGERLQLEKLNMPREDYRLVIPQLISHIEKYYANQFQGIGISSTGLVDPISQEIGMMSPLYEGFGKTLVKNLRDCFGVPVTVENDGNCALLAEKWIGKGQACTNLVMIVLGTSVGGALMINDQLVKGSHLMAGELGYMLFPTKEKPWEIWSIAGSTKTLVTQVSNQKGKILDGYEVIELYHQQDAQTQRHVAAFIEKLAVGCYNLQYILDPEKILIGGGISHNAFLLPALRQKIQEISGEIPSNIRIPSVEMCQFGNESNLIGACYYWLTQQKKQEG